jgi:uncharacterized protein YqjF (DUF2071 family)
MSPPCWRTARRTRAERKSFKTSGQAESPVHHARVLELRESMVTAAGLPVPEGEPLAHYSPGVDLDVFALR